MGSSPWGHKESATIEHTFAHTRITWIAQHSDENGACFETKSVCLQILTSSITTSKTFEQINNLFLPYFPYL